MIVKHHKSPKIFIRIVTKKNYATRIWEIIVEGEQKSFPTFIVKYTKIGKTFTVQYALFKITAQIVVIF